jgi:hypothetical protein
VRQARDEEPGFTFGIACGADTLTLLDPLGRVLDRVQIPALAPRATWGRLPDGAGDFALTAASLGEPNAALGPPAPALFDPLRRTTVEISIPQANVDRLFADPRGKVQARLRVIDADGLSLGWRVVGMHIKGRIGSARDLNGKPGLRIDLNAVSEDGEIDGLENLTLNNMVQDPSFVHEWATYALFRALGLPAPRVGFTWVRINDQDYGLYAQIETYDDVFVGQHLPPTAQRSGVQDTPSSHCALVVQVVPLAHPTPTMHRWPAGHIDGIAVCSQRPPNTHSSSVHARRSSHCALALHSPATPMSGAGAVSTPAGTSTVGPG